jgi:hypothetical protein
MQTKHRAPHIALARVGAALLAWQIAAPYGCGDDDDESEIEAPPIDSVCAAECSAIEACYDWHWAEFNQDMETCLSYCIGYYEDQRDTEFDGEDDCFQRYMIYRKCFWDEILSGQCDEPAAEQACEVEWTNYVECEEGG